jgi:hypothetical protein
MVCVLIACVEEKTKIFTEMRLNVGWGGVPVDENIL